MPTLSSSEILLDVIRAFAIKVPAARLFGNNFSKEPLKYNKTYYPHIASNPTVENVTSTYAVTGTAARTLLQDNEITISARKGSLLRFQQLYAIQDDKWEYNRLMTAAGAVLAKSFIDDLATQWKASRFSQEVTYTAANADLDMVNAVTANLNSNGASNDGRVMFVNSTVASTLNSDATFTSKDYAGQNQGANGYRTWNNLNGFATIQEYPSFPSNDGTALTSVTCTAATDLVTKAAHGFETGDRVYCSGFSAGLTTGYYYVILVSSSTFKIATTPTNAVAGTAVDISADGTGGTVQQKENLIAFGADSSAVSFMAGMEDHASINAMASAMGINQVIAFDSVSDPDSGISMSLVKYQEAGTGDLIWMPLLLWGKVAGRKAGANAIGSYGDYGGCRVISA